MAEKTKGNLTPLELARLLAKAGSKAVTEDGVKLDVANGAPANADGTINLVAYIAWLVNKTERGERDGN